MKLGFLDLPHRRAPLVHRAGGDPAERVPGCPGEGLLGVLATRHPDMFGSHLI